MSLPSSSLLLSASEIAKALDISPQSIRGRLKKTKPAGQFTSGGNPTKGYDFYDLPSTLCTQLRAWSDRYGCDDPVRLIKAGGIETWKPEIPLSECSADDVQKAEDLKRALTPALEVHDDGRVNGSQLNEILASNYKRVFGREVSSEYLRRILSRTIKRDGGRSKWQRLELYLPDCPKRRRTEPETHSDGIDAEFMGIAGKQLDPQNKALIWDRAFQVLDEAGDAYLAVRSGLLDSLFESVPGLAKSRNALRVNLDRKFKQWKTNGKALAAIDDTRIAPPKRAHQLQSEEFQFLRFLVTKRDGNISLAWRDFHLSNKATTETKLKTDPARLPRHIREQCRADSILLPAQHRGKRSAALTGAHITRNPESICAGDWDQADDKTLEIYWWEDTPEGMWFGQGQLLVWCDVRSWMLYGYDLISSGQYTGFSVRNSWTAKCVNHGLPRLGVYVENGIWRDSKVWNGRHANRSHFEIGTQETERGIRDLDMKVCNARLPRGKIIERVFGETTNLIEGAPGGAGRNQPVDVWDRVQKQVREVKSWIKSGCKPGGCHPSKYFMHKKAVMKLLDESFERFNNSPLYGAYHKGRTPVQVYQQEFGGTELKKVDDSNRFAIATNSVTTNVTTNGVTFKYGNRRFNYKDARLGPLTGHKTNCRFNPEDPEFLSVMDERGKLSFVAKRSAEVDYGADKETLRKAHAEVAAQNSYSKEAYRSVVPYFDEEFRKRRFITVDPNPKIVEAGRKHQEAAKNIRKQTRERDTLRKRVERKARQAKYDTRLIDYSDLFTAERNLDLMLESDRETLIHDTE